MQELFIGEAIKKRRLALGLTQEQLCEGICEPITISRLENGKQTPSRNRINAILERLDMPADRFYALLSKNELDVEALQKEIVALNVRFGHADAAERAQIREQAADAHQKLESIMEKDDMISRQLILRSRVLLNKSGESAFSLEQQIAMLTEAIKLTIPSFELDEIGNNLYTTAEIKIINQLATAYADEGNHAEAVSILSQLFKYIKKHFQNIPVTRAHLNLVAYNYAIELATLGQYEQAIRIAEEGQQICIDFGHYLLLPGFLATMAECNHFLGDDTKSKDLYWQSYYLYKAVKNDRDMAHVQEEMRRYFSLETDA